MPDGLDALIDQAAADLEDDEDAPSAPRVKDTQFVTGWGSVTQMTDGSFLLNGAPIPAGHPAIAAFGAQQQGLTPAGRGGGQDVYYEDGRYFVLEEVPGAFDPAVGPRLQKTFIPDTDPRVAELWGEITTNGAPPTLSPNVAAQIEEDARQFNETMDRLRGLDVVDQQQFAATLGLNTAQLTENARQFDVGLQFDRESFNARAEQAAQQFNIGAQIDVGTVNAQLTQQAALANQQAQIDVASINANLAAQQASLTEQIRQFDIRMAQEQENLRFMAAREQIAIQEGNQARLQSAVALREQIQSRINSIELQRTGLVTEVNSINAQIANNVAMFNSQEAARVEALNEARRQANLQQLQDVSSEIGELAQNPADVGKLAAFLRAGSAAPISEAVARGEDAITDESLLGLRGLLGVREELQQGPEVATPNFIEGQFVEAPTFQTSLGEVPDISQLFQPISADFSQFGTTPIPEAPDISQFFQPISQPAQITAPQIEMPALVEPSLLSTITAPTVVQPQIAPTTIDRSFGNPDAPVSVEAAISTAAETGEAGIAPAGATQDDLMAIIRASLGMADGGTTNSRVMIVGEEGPEIVVRNPDGSTTVIPNDQITEAQDGGLFPAPDILPASRERVSEQISQSVLDPRLGTGEIAPVSADTARLFLSDVQRDALRRGGFTDVSQISPLKVSAPGTSRFLQDLSASVAGVHGFGPASLFFEELRRLQPRGVARGIARRTA